MSCVRIRRHQQIFPTLTLILTFGSDVRQRHLPRVKHRTEQAGSGRGGDVENKGSALRVEVEINIVRGCIRSGDLKFPVGRPGPVNNIAVLRLRVTEERLTHCVETDDRYAPEDNLNSTALAGTAGKVAGRERESVLRWFSLHIHLTVCGVGNETRNSTLTRTRHPLPMGEGCLEVPQVGEGGASPSLEFLRHSFLTPQGAIGLGRPA